MSESYTYDHVPRNFLQWIESNKHLLQPPVCNALMSAQELKIMIVGGPNTRSDYHTNPTEEWFYQIKGSMVLRVVDNGHPKDIHIAEGHHFLLPPNTPHSPQRFADTIGLVVECDRPTGQQDALSYYCPKCGHTNISERFICTNLVTQLPPIINGYYASEEQRTCKQCEHVDTKPTVPVTIPDSLDTSQGRIGVEVPGPQPISAWITQPNAQLSGIALHVATYSHTTPSSLICNGGETWIYSIEKGCHVDLYASETDHTVTQTLALNAADCVILRPDQPHAIRPEQYAVVVTHINQDKA